MTPKLVSWERIRMKHAFSLVTQRSSSLSQKETAAHIRTTFVFYCFITPLKWPIIYHKIKHDGSFTPELCLANKRPLWITLKTKKLSNLFTARKIIFTHIYSVKIWCKKVQTRGKLKAKMVNTTFVCQFTRGCKFYGKCGIYHLCPLFNLSLPFFAPNLHRVNLV